MGSARGENLFGQGGGWVGGMEVEENETLRMRSYWKLGLGGWVGTYPKRGLGAA